MLHVELRLPLLPDVQLFVVRRSVVLCGPDAGLHHVQLVRRAVWQRLQRVRHLQLELQRLRHELGLPGVRRCFEQHPAVAAVRPAVAAERRRRCADAAGRADGSDRPGRAEGLSLPREA